MTRMLGAGCLCCLVLLAISAPCNAANPVFDALTRRGVVIGPGEVIRLPPPVMADGLSADQQRRAIELLPGNRHSWEELTRRTAVAPFVLSISKQTPGTRMAGRVDLAFILYADMKQIGSDEFITDQLRPPSRRRTARRASFSRSSRTRSSNVGACAARR